MIKYVNRREVSGNDSVKVRSHPWATTDDFIDYVRPTVRKKPNLIIIHSGTNDIQNNVNTLQKIRKVISSIKEYDTDDNIKIALSSIIHRSDHDFEDKINETNRKLENLCKGKGMIFINNSNIDSTCLNRSKLHLNKSGTSLLIKNFSKAVNSAWLINGNDNDEVLNLTNSSIVSFSSMSHLRNLRSKNAGNIIFSYLNINSIRNKFENLCELVAGNVDILCIAETKLDPSFPNSQFLIPGFHKPLRMDVSSRRGELLVYIKSSLPSKMLTKFKQPNNIQIILFELNLRKDKWLFASIYKPPLQNNQYFVSILSHLLDFYSNEYDNKIVLEDFNLKLSSPSMLSFMDSQNFVGLIKNKTCFKGAGSCIDLILTDRKYSFKITSSYNTRVCDHYHLIYSVMKTTFKCEEPKK